MIKKNKIRLGNYILVNYHYVRDPSDKFPGINSCSVEEFEKQIKFLSENFKILSIPEVFRAAKKKARGKFCAVTFDDCLKDVYVNAFPILKKYGVTSTIFLIASVLEKKLPSVHKLHILLSKFSAGELIEEFNRIFSGRYSISKSIRIYKNKRLDDDIPTANLKETLTVIPQNLKNNFIKSIFKNLKFNEAETVENLFMNIKEIKGLCNSGFILGNHSYSHNNLSDLSVIEIRMDIKKAKKIIADFFGKNKKIDVFSYPSGRWSKNVMDALQDEKIEYGLTIEERSVSSKDSPFLIPRYDANNIRDYLNSIK
jgi:peptidoglycan/xylan/chitin deacetylase (PgdA/CDA1 family)